MWYDSLFKELENLENEEQSKKMSAYMQNKFTFLGIQKPLLKEAVKQYLKDGKKYDLDWKFVSLCWQKDYREAQYVAIDYLNQNIKKLTEDDLPKLKELIIQKSWWETVDSIDAMIGSIVQKNPELEKDMLEWSESENIWLRRVAIDFQQEYKEKTNTELLEQIINNNLGSNEFFINKAIGWSLRDYSKINPEWVRSFLKKYEDRLSKLSIKEASKYIQLKKNIENKI
jgi:3-methyladenine DNA glycosylase AlkD